MMERIDARLNDITMYRLVLYYLAFLLGMAVLYSFAGILQYDPFALLLTTAFLLAACLLTNALFSRVFGVPANAESSYISALILALIITPLQSYNDLAFLAWAAILAMASKYILALNKKHIFNPAALAVAITYYTINQSASWWIADGPMLPFVLLGGFLIVRKIRRFDLVGSFLAAVLAMTLGAVLFAGADLGGELQRVAVLSPVFFFAFVILTEPLTTPPTRGRQRVYGALVGVLFAPQFHLGGLYTTPELAILIGNVFSYLVSPRATLILRLVRRIPIGPDTYDFILAPSRKFAFAPGQYMEWTLGHADPDSRGNRRFFTLASAPTEDHVRVGVKFSRYSSSFKLALLSMKENTEIVASNLAGDFTLPRSRKQPLVFIAGGVGITPFRSMLQYLLDTKQPRPITLFYANRTVDEIVYRDVLDRAERELGIRTIYTVTDPTRVPAGWTGQVGRIGPKLIKAGVPDYARSLFYISGSQGMVQSFKQLLQDLHIPESQIKTDFFSGL